MRVLEEFKEKARSANVVPVVDTISADLLTPLAVYLKLSDGSENSFLLESVEGGETLARYSFIGAEPDFIALGDGKATQVASPEGRSDLSVPMLQFLREHFAKYRVHSDESLPSFIGGAIGTFNFECSAWFEPCLKKAGFNDDSAAMMFFSSIVAFDHAKQVIQIITLVFTDEAGGEDARLETLFEKAKADNERIRARLEADAVKLPHESNNRSADAVSKWERTNFEAAVSEIKERINAGEAYQVVISQCFSKPTNASPVAIYRAVRSLNPSPYMFLVRFGDRSVIGASPEMLVRVRGRDLEYRPIAGTRPRGRSADEDVQ